MGQTHALNHGTSRQVHTRAGQPRQACLYPGHIFTNARRAALVLRGIVRTQRTVGTSVFTGGRYGDQNVVQYL